MERRFGKQRSESHIKITKAMKVQVQIVKGPVSKIDLCSICGERVKINAIECTACKAWLIIDVRGFVVPDKSEGL